MEQFLLVPTPDTAEHSGLREVLAGKELRLLVLWDDEGLPVLPAFTSEEALTRWSPRVRTTSASRERCSLRSLREAIGTGSSMAPTRAGSLSADPKH
jgi:type III secretion system (T3SS) SseB-like protein